MRNTKQIALKETLHLQVVGENPVKAYDAIIAKMAGIDAVESVNSKGDDVTAFMVGTTEFAVPLGGLVDMQAEIEKAEAELHRLEGFLQGIQKKLSNERFVNNAPAAVVEMERKKQADTETKMAALRDSLAAWKKA